MVKLTTKIVKSTDLWSKINLCKKSLILRKINDNSNSDQSTIYGGHTARKSYDIDRALSKSSNYLTREDFSYKAQGNHRQRKLGYIRLPDIPKDNYT
jgi:hypothetical protein